MEGKGKHFLSFTGGGWERGRVEVESREPLSGDMSVTIGCLGPAEVIVDDSLERFPNQSTEESEQVWAGLSLVPYSSLGLPHL